MTEQADVQVNLVKQIFNILDREHKKEIGKYELGVFAQAINIPLYNKELNSVLQVYGKRGTMNSDAFLLFISDSLDKVQIHDTDLTRVLDIVAKRLGAEGIWKRYQLSTEEIELLTALFKDSDRDHSGFLSSTEVQKFFGKMGIKVGETEVNALVSKYGNKQNNLQLQHFLDLVEDIFVMGNVQEGEVLRTLQELNKVIGVKS